jgi:hypothetical protein
MRGRKGTLLGVARGVRAYPHPPFGHLLPMGDGTNKKALDHSAQGFTSTQHLIKTTRTTELP